MTMTKKVINFEEKSAPPKRKSWIRLCHLINICSASPCSYRKAFCCRVYVCTWFAHVDVGGVFFVMSYCRWLRPFGNLLQKNWLDTTKVGIFTVLIKVFGTLSAIIMHHNHPNTKTLNNAQHDILHFPSLIITGHNYATSCFAQLWLP